MAVQLWYCYCNACSTPSIMPLQAAVRSKHGEATTAFERITDGSRTAAAGDVVRINAKPQLVGRVLFFTIPQASSQYPEDSGWRVLSAVVQCQATL